MIPANVTWSSTPAARALLASCAALGVAFGRMNSLGDRDQPITWPNTDPVRLLSTLSPLRYRSADPKLATGRMASAYPGGTSTRWTP